MAIFDFLKKKKEEFPAFQEPRLPGEDIGLPPERPAALPQPPDYPERPMQMPPLTQVEMPQPQMLNKDFELISAKLDSIKSALEVINQRLSNLEHIAAGEKREYF